MGRPYFLKFLKYFTTFGGVTTLSVVGRFCRAAHDSVLNPSDFFVPLGSFVLKANESMAGIKSIGILTSGGDAPGMNAAIRAVTRSAIFNGFTVKGIMRRYKGLVFNEIVEFKSQSVSNIIQLGGTILKTARSQEFTTPEGRKAAYDNMVAAGIDALVVICGDGSLTGAGIFAEEFNVPIVGLPGTIDNDLGGTDSTIGYDTALNTIMEAVDKLRDTASSHERPRSSLRWRPRSTSWPNSSTTASARARTRRS